MIGRSRLNRVSLLLVAASLAGCGGDPSNLEGPPPANQAMPDFHLVDANPNSATSGQPVSPRDYAQKVSAWYFGHST
jgi:hypothetical protein